MASQRLWLEKEKRMQANRQGRPIHSGLPGRISVLAISSSPEPGLMAIFVPSSTRVVLAVLRGM